MSFSSLFLGEIAALSAAFLWAAAAVLFEKIGRRIRPLEMNLLKGSLAIVLLLLTLWLTRSFQWNIPGWAVAVLLVSGAVGIGLGDTAYFAALQNIGIRRNLLLGTLAPPLTAVMGLMFLSERMAWSAWLGVFITTAGVAWVITEQTSGKGEAQRPAGHLMRGVIFGVISAVCQAGGAILSRLVFMQTEVSALESALLRLIAGVGILYIWIIFQKQPILQWTKEPGRTRLWALIVTSVVFGTYLAIWLQQIAFKLAPTAIAQTLVATSPIFSLPIAWFMGEKLTLRAVLGVLVAVVGVALLF